MRSEELTALFMISVQNHQALLSGSKSLLKSITYNGFRTTKSVKLVKNNSIGSQTLQYLVKYH
jgi:hypothetical protein